MCTKMAGLRIFCLLLGTFVFTGSTLAEVCTYYDDILDDEEDMYCSTGCCGDYFDQYCCLATGDIAGAVVGSCVFFFIVAVVIYLCCRRRTNRTLVWTRLQEPTVAVVHTGNVATVSSSVPVYPGGRQMAPPPYTAY